MDARRLRYFVTVAQLGSFSAAARRLHIAQPALSRQVKALEAMLGVALLVRDARGVSLTHEGEELLAARSARPRADSTCCRGSSAPRACASPAAWSSACRLPPAR